MIKLFEFKESESVTKKNINNRLFNKGGKGIKSTVMQLAMDTNTSIEWYMNLPFDELHEWIEIYNNISGEKQIKMYFKNFLYVDYYNKEIF